MVLDGAGTAVLRLCEIGGKHLASLKMKGFPYDFEMGVRDGGG